MGSWFGTCGLTKLPIYDGEEVKVVILQKNKRVNHSYATALYTPIMGAFDDVYADYGRGENPEKDDIYLIHQENIINALQEFELGENQYHDIAVKKEGFNGELFYDAIHEERLKVFSRCKTNTYDLDFVMFKKSAYWTLLNSYKTEMYNGDFSYYGLTDLYNEIDNFCDTFRKLFEESITEVVQLEDKSKASKLFFYITNPLIAPNCKIANNLFSSDSFGEASRVSDVTTNIRKYITDAAQLQTLTPENIHAAISRFDAVLPQIKQYLKSCTETKMISLFFEGTRQIWTPGFHVGSQSNELSNYNILLQCISSELKSMDSDYDD